MSLAQRFALIFGAIYLAVGILGFITPLFWGRVVPGWGLAGGYLLALFAVNWLHNLAHVAIGGAGLATFRVPAAASIYALVIGVAYALLFLVGLFGGPVGPLDGLLPLNGWNNALHLLTALVAFGAYFFRRGPRPEGSPEIGRGVARGRTSSNERAILSLLWLRFTAVATKEDRPDNDRLLGNTKLG